VKKEVLQLSVQLDYLLFGIVTSLSAVKLAWHLNNTGVFNFWRTQNINLANYNPQVNTEITVFESADEENHLHWKLIYNKDQPAGLLKELKPFDYLLFVTGGTEFINEVYLLDVVRNIKQIIAVNIIEEKKIKDKLSRII